MATKYIASVAALASFASTVAAHGYVTGLVTGGTWYGAYEPVYQYYSTPPDVAGWTTTNSNGPLFPDQYPLADIVCNLNGTAGKASVPVTAGSTVELQWTAWPETHHGPVMTYLAPCSGSDCTTATINDLSFVKIQELGLISGSATGYWASDKLIAENNSIIVTIPSSLKPGPYVLRHEIIALHSAGTDNGAQNYPYCINLLVTGSGTTAITGGKPATQLYTRTDPGIVFDIYTSFTSYPIPGPPLWTGASSSGGAAATTTTTTRASSTTTTSTRTTAASSSGAASSSTTTRTTTRTTTTTATTTTAAATATSTSCAVKYGQCGGTGWTGPTCCTSSTCTFSNAYYSQCL